MNVFKLSRAGANLMEDFDRHFGDLFSSLAPPVRSESMSGIGLFESDNGYRIEIDVPGVAASNVSVEMLDHRLTVKGTRPEPLLGEEGAVHHRRESRYGAFERSIELAKDAAEDGIDAELVNGVLVLEIPKAEAARKRSVSIRDGR